MNDHENSRVYEMFGRPCEECDIAEGLTRHHLKDFLGRKTGEIKILCRSCHDEAEKEYIMFGIIPTKKKRKLSHNQKLERDYRDGKIPFYSIYPKFKEICYGYRA